MDPGNWATDLEGGARFGYSLLWVLVMSNAMAVLLQTLSARLGIVRGRDLAQACRETYPRAVNLALWVLCEIAVAACDLAEVIGAAIGLNLLFHIPLLAGVLITSADTLLLLWFQSFGIRTIEAVVLSLITVMAICFGVEIFWAKPAVSELLTGLAPTLSRDSLYVAIGILGATVMPHNLYLHSALVQTRNIGHSDAEKRTACRYNFIDSVVALNGALLVNAAILVMAAAVFFKRHIVVTEIQQAHLLLAPLLGTGAAGVLFAIALLASGQSSTLTGTMAGQIVMEGFLNFRMRPWLRRLLTRSLAVAPAAFTIWYAGDKATYRLLILSQVILSMQLPFAVIPLIHFTSDRNRMGEFANKAWVLRIGVGDRGHHHRAERAAGGHGDRGLAGGGGRLEDRGVDRGDSDLGRLSAAADVGHDGTADEPVDAQVRTGAGIRAGRRGCAHCRPGLSPDPRAAGPYGAGPPGGEPRRRHGQALRSLHLPAARGGGRNQPGVRPGSVHGGGGTG